MKVSSRMFAVTVQCVSVQQVNWSSISRNTRNISSLAACYVVNVSDTKDTSVDVVMTSDSTMVNCQWMNTLWVACITWLSSDNHTCMWHWFMYCYCLIRFVFITVCVCTLQANRVVRKHSKNCEKCCSRNCCALAGGAICQMRVQFLLNKIQMPFFQCWKIPDQLQLTCDI